MYTQLLNHVQFTDPMDCSRPGSSVHGIFQARILEWVAISYSDIRHKILEKIKFFKKFTEVIFGGVCVCVCARVCVFSFFNTDHQHFQIRNISQEKEIFSLDFTFFFIRISVFFPMSGSSRPGTLYSQNLFQVKGIFNSVFSHLNNDICLLVPLTLDCKLYKINI